MFAAMLGLIGVLVGVFLTQGLSASARRRENRLDALAGAADATAHVIVAHERLYELLADRQAPPLESKEAQRAFVERREAHAQWRAARARTEILIPDHDDLAKAFDKFERARADATKWVRAYQRFGTAYRLDEDDDLQRQSWKDMRAGRLSLIAVSQTIVRHDTRWIRSYR